MANYTPNYNLILPDGSENGDFVDVDDLNGNFDTIDTELKQSADHIADTVVHVTAEKQVAWDGYDARLDLQERFLTATIPITGWSGTAPFYVAVTVTGLTDSRPDINPIYSATLATALLEKESWNKISYIDCTANTMTVYCLEEIPETPINVELVGG